MINDTDVNNRKNTQSNLPTNSPHVSPVAKQNANGTMWHMHCPCCNTRTRRLPRPSVLGSGLSLLLLDIFLSYIYYGAYGCWLGFWVSVRCRFLVVHTHIRDVYVFMRRDVVWAKVDRYLFTEFNHFEHFSPGLLRYRILCSPHSVPLSTHDLARQPKFHSASQGFHQWRLNGLDVS